MLERLLRWRGAADRRVVVGPRCGVDAAVVRVGPQRLVLKSDPVTFTTTHLGWYAVQVNANDVAVMGARPAWFQPTILLPPRTRGSQVEAIVRDIHRACRALAIAVTGGHTEVRGGRWSTFSVTCRGGESWAGSRSGAERNQGTGGGRPTRQPSLRLYHGHHCAGAGVIREAARIDRQAAAGILTRRFPGRWGQARTLPRG